MAEKSVAKDAMDKTHQVEFRNQKAFLLAIHQRFLNIVQPRESGLLDHLRQSVIDSDAEEEITAETTRRDKARKLWQVLYRISPEDFRDHCYPLLKNLYGHVLERVRYVYDARANGDIKVCVRHIIRQRMSLRRFADVFPDTNGCNLDEYEEITEGFANDAKWELAFKLCAKNKQNDLFIQKFKGVLKDVSAEVPENLSTILSKGFPCICGMRRRRNLKRKACMMSSYSTWSTVDSVSSNDHENPSASISSQGPKEPESGGDETHFATDEQRDDYIKALRRMNASIVKSSNIRTLSREITGIREELSVMEEKMNAGTTWKKAFLDRGKYHNLLVRARDIYRTLQIDAKEIKDTAEMVKGTAVPFDLQLPTKRKKFLLERRQALWNEMNDAFHFFKQAESLYMSIPNNPWLDSLIY